MHSINTLFEKTYVLTIERNNDRHPSVEKNLSGIAFEYWYGNDLAAQFPEKTYVAEIPEQFFAERDADKGFLTRYTRGQAGAYLSIGEMWRHIAKEGYERTLLFEDDFSPLRNDWQEITEAAVRELPADWHVLYLGYIYDGRLYKYNHHRPLRPLIRRFSKSSVQPKKVSNHLDKAGLVNGGHAYCLSKKGAAFLNTFLHPITLAGDRLLWGLTKKGLLNAYAVYPNLFKQDNKKFGSKTSVL